MMNDPLLQQVLQTPSLMKEILENDSTLKKLCLETPQVKDIMMNPD